MAKDDLKDYRNALTAIRLATAVGQINRLAAIGSNTEDAKLAGLVERLRERLRNGSAKLAQREYENVDKYAKAVIDSKKPAWQVIALNAGWRPPRVDHESNGATQ